MQLDRTILHEALDATTRDAATPRTAVEEDRLMDGFVAEFVAGSESLEGHDTNSAEVLDSARDLAFA
jgi:hypothetical protein